MSGQQIPRQPTDPDDRKTYNTGAIFAAIVGFFANIWRYPLKVLDNQFSILDDADTTKVMQFSASGVGAGTTKTFGVPNASGTLTVVDAAQTIDNKTLTNTNAITVKDASFTVQDDGDTSKQFRLQVSGVTASTTRTGTVPDADFTFATTATTQNITNKTFDSTDTATQDSLTTLTAGTNITLGATGWTTQGTRKIHPTGGAVYLQCNLTAGAAIAAGSVVATIGSGHRPPGTISTTMVKNAGGTYTAIAVLINSAGQIVNETALANTDTLTGTVVLMTS